jgi:phosphoglycolate phosphatase-like HAD superfamily hydrolase
MEFKAIVLDFDGVVVESNEIKHRAFSEMFNGYAQYEEIMRYHFSHNHVCRQDKFRHILKGILGQPVQETDIVKMAYEFSLLTRQKIIECPLVPGAEDFIVYFSSKVPLYIASATPIDELMLIIEGRKLNQYFKGIYGAPSRKFEMFNDILNKEKISSSDLLFIGDSKEDYEVTIRSGLQFIGRSRDNNFHSIEVPIYNDLCEIKSYIKINT